MLSVRAPLLVCLALAAATALCQAASQPLSPPSSHAASPQQRHASGPNGRVANQQDKAESSPPPVLPGAKPSTSAPTNHKSREGHEEPVWQGVWEAIIALATIALVVVTSALVYYTKRLWASTSHLVGDAKDSSQKDLRAYIAIEDIFFSRTIETVIKFLQSGDSVREHCEVTDERDLRIRVRNHGRTPAHQMTIKCDCLLHPPGPDPHEFSGLLVAEQMLHPQQVYAAKVPFGDLPISAQTANFYVVGRATYRDIHNAWWITDFSYWYKGERVFAPHGEHNRERGPFQKCPN